MAEQSNSYAIRGAPEQETDDNEDWDTDDTSKEEDSSEDKKPKAKMYEYRDYSSLQTSPAQTSKHPRSCPQSSVSGDIDRKFPAKLYQMLSMKKFQHIISWLPHGRSFKIWSVELLVETVLPIFFESANYNSFVRLLNAWKFRRIKNSSRAETNKENFNSYYHELFLRGMPHLLSKMKRLPKKMRKLPMDKSAEPDFSLLPPLPEISESPEGNQSASNSLDDEDHHESPRAHQRVLLEDSTPTELEQQVMRELLSNPLSVPIDPIARALIVDDSRLLGDRILQLSAHADQSHLLATQSHLLASWLSQGRRQPIIGESPPIDPVLCLAQSPYNLLGQSLGTSFAVPLPQLHPSVSGTRGGWEGANLRMDRIMLNETFSQPRYPLEQPAFLSPMLSQGPSLSDRQLTLCNVTQSCYGIGGGGNTGSNIAAAPGLMDLYARIASQYAPPAFPPNPPSILLNQGMPSLEDLTFARRILNDASNLEQILAAHEAVVQQGNLPPHQRKMSDD